MLKELKDFDLKDLSTKASEKKSSASSLKNLTPFVNQVGDTITLKQEAITAHIAERQEALISQNTRVQAKLFETAQWIDSFVRGLNTTKDSTASPATTNSLALSTESSLLSASSAKKIEFQEGKLNEIVSKIQVTYIPDTKFISIQTYQQIVDNSVELAEEEFIRLTFESRNGNYQPPPFQ